MWHDAKGFAKVDIDPTNANQTQAAIYLFGGIQFQLSVPDKWINSFKTGATMGCPGIARSKEWTWHSLQWRGLSWTLQTPDMGDLRMDYTCRRCGVRSERVCGRFASVVQLCGLCTKRIALHTASSPLGAARRESVAGEPLPGPGSNAYSNASGTPTPTPPSPDYPMSGSYQFGMYKVDWTATVNDPVPTPSRISRIVW